MKHLESQVLNISKFHYNPFLTLPNVRGVGYGFKYVNNKCTYEPCIHVLVNKKINKLNLSYDKLIPKSFMGIKTDVLESGLIKVNSLNDRIRPLEGGYRMSIKDENGISYGTIGCIVKKGTLFKSYYILSCNHVLTNGNLFPKNTPIIQPANGNKITDTVAKLSRFVEIKFTTPYEELENQVDCALAKLIDYKNVSKKIAFLGEIKGVGTPKLHLKVMKVGAITGLTYGKITTLGATIVNTYSKNREALFTDQIITTAMAEEGDSGSLLLDYNNKAIGLLMAGSDSITDFNDINLVLKALNVTFL